MEVSLCCIISGTGKSLTVAAAVAETALEIVNFAAAENCEVAPSGETTWTCQKYVPDVSPSIVVDTVSSPRFGSPWTVRTAATEANVSSAAICRR